MIIQENPEVVASKKICTRTTHIATSEHLASLDYKNSLPLKTPMLTVAHKEAHVSWATRHLNDNWETTLFSDETAFQLFRNTITQWYKCERPVQRIPKIALKSSKGGFCIHEKT